MPKPVAIVLAPSDVKRFWKFVLKTSTCWIWKGARYSLHGYGAFGCRSWEEKWVARQAHRVSWLIATGTLPEGLFVLHKCDNRSCVRPDHLFLGTQRDNLADMTQKGRRSRHRLGLHWSEEHRKRVGAKVSISQKRRWALRKGLKHEVV